ncbi:putative protease SohB [Saliniradius amylolyticus]|uniref:Putative protease SohB n=1 Tax=Saliniradius amylolyticus TaxID=2183582 RepID=A0A2S2E2F0_9ALTE|nr:protease SohB [Saliniradius amylolyticus]AWL11769.1 putative protease SohB [Saliniradius amylolyticus]
MQFLYEYGLFLLQAITIVVAILLAVGGIMGLANRHKHNKGELEITSLSERLDHMVEQAQHVLLDKNELKKRHKARKKEQKQQSKNEQAQNKLFVIDFKGSIDAREVEQLREEVSAILSVAEDNDEVLVRLESGGGMVHGYGLAASQLQRFRDHKIKMTVSVDKVAASGGYMMACVADKIISAPFAIVGSIGVIAQLPNFHRLLDKNYIDFEQHTAGEFKRTLTLFGKNDDLGRKKFREELEQVHGMFKDFVSEHRPKLDIGSVATGEYWYGIKAKTMELVDEIKTSDDFLFAANKERQIYKVEFKTRKNLAEKLGQSVSVGTESLLDRLWQKLQLPWA